MTRRQLIASAAAGVSGVAVAARIAGQKGLIPPDAASIYGCGHTLTYAAQRLLTSNANAREFPRDKISRIPHPKGDPPSAKEFATMQAGGFKDWRLQIAGMVRKPVSLSIADLKTSPPRSQITQLICEEGWSYIAEWTGASLSQLLNETGLLPEARYVVYESMDGWFDALDLDEAMHPQTLIAYGFNSQDMPVGHGGPLRMRVPKQLGYKSMKYLNKVTLTDTLKGKISAGSYSWYAGI